jgi:hypothetical protein
MIGTPTKAIMDELTALSAKLESVSEDSDAELINDLYYACAKLMSRNKTGTKIEKEYLENIFDLEDIIIFFNAYMGFINTLATEKN